MFNLQAIKSKLRDRGDTPQQSEEEELPSMTMTLRTQQPSIVSGQPSKASMHVFGLGSGKPCALYAWVIRRTQSYAQFAKDWSYEELEDCACRDYLDWLKSKNAQQQDQFSFVRDVEVEKINPF